MRSGVDFLVLAHWNNSPRVDMSLHWGNSPRVDMSLHSDTLIFQSLFFFLNAACLVEKQQIQIL